MNTCKGCKWWALDEGEQTDGVIFPEDPDSFEKMLMPFEVRYCHSPKLLFYERPIESTGAAIFDGSGYRGLLATAEDFGCVNHEAKE